MSGFHVLGSVPALLPAFGIGQRFPMDNAAVPAIYGFQLHLSDGSEWILWLYYAHNKEVFFLVVWLQCRPFA